MSLHLGGQPVTKVYLGDKPVTKICNGSQLVWSAAPSVDWHSVFPWTYSWLADDLADGAVASWADGQAGVALTQATETAQPTKSGTSGANSQPGILFASGKTVASPTPTISQPFSLVVIGRVVASGVTQPIISGGAITLSQRMGSIAMNAGLWVAPPSGGNDGSARVMAAMYAGVASSLRLAGVVAATGDVGAGALASLTVGGTAVSVISAIGIVAGDATTAPEWSALAGLIATKWGLVA